MTPPRDWSVYPIGLIDPDGSYACTYAKVRADEGALGVGRRASVWMHRHWVRTVVTTAPTDAIGGGATLWLRPVPE